MYLKLCAMVQEPELPDPSLNNWGFKVSDGQLTSMGMRQRHLLGRYHQHKYKDEENFENILNGIVAENLIVDSTDYYRTIQSIYSQLHGLKYVNGNSNQTTISQTSSTHLMDGSRGIPKFAIRNISRLIAT